MCMISGLLDPYEPLFMDLNLPNYMEKSVKYRDIKTNLVNLKDLGNRKVRKLWKRRSEKWKTGFGGSNIIGFNGRFE